MHKGMRTRRQFLADALKIGGTMALVGSGLGSLAGCGAPVPTAPAGGAGTPLRVRMGIVPGVQPLWRFLASRNAEWLQPLGYAVEFINFTDENTMRTAFLNGDIEVLAATVPATPALVEHAGPCQFFLPYAWTRHGLSLFVKKDSPVQTVTDLKGRKVSVYPEAHPGFAYWRAAVVANYGFRMEDEFDLIHSGQPDLAVDTGDAEAALVGGWGWVRRRETGEYRLVANLYEEWQRVLGSDRLLILGGAMARTEWLTANRSFVADYQNLARQAMQILADTPAAFFAEAAAWTGQGTAPPLTTEEIEFLSWYDGLIDAGPGRISLAAEDIADNQKVFSYLYQAGYLQQEPSAAEVAAMFYLGS